MRKVRTSPSRFLSHRELSEDRNNLRPCGTHFSARNFASVPYTIARRGTYMRRTYLGLRTYLRRVRWYMEVAPKFPRGEIRLTDDLNVSFPLSAPSPSLPFSSDFRASLPWPLLPLQLLPTVRRPNPSFAFRECSRAHLADVYVYSTCGGDSCSFAALSCRVRVELSRLRSAETALMDFEILPWLSCIHEIT